MAANDKILFRIGSQSSLNTMLTNNSGYDVGTFYLTSDTDRLYIGQASGLKLLNKAVMTVASMAELNTLTSGWGTNSSVHKDDIAYISGENVLAYFNGTSWAQINPDTVSNVLSLTTGVTATTDGAKVSTVLTQDEGGNKTADFTITGENGVKVVNGSSSNVKITGDTYTLTPSVSGGNGVLTLSSALGQASSSATIAAGSNITITGSGSTITVAATDTVLTGNALSIDSTGKLTSAVTDSKTTKSANVTLGYNVGGNFVGIGGNGTSNGVDLPVYSKTEIDTLFKNLNGLTYCGTVGTSGQYEMSNYTINTVIHNGDMFLVSGSCTYESGKTANTGDLLIATGTENAEGILTSVTWTYVPSGDDTTTDTQYTWTVNASTKSAVVSGNPGGTKYQYKLVEGAATTIDVTTNSTNDLYQATISHADVECAETDKDVDLSQSSNTLTVTAVSGLTVNDQGHVTAVETTDYNLIKYQGSMPVIGTETNGLKFTAAIVANGSTTANSSSTLKLVSETVDLSYSNGTITAELLWGSF